MKKRGSLSNGYLEKKKLGGFFNTKQTQLSKDLGSGLGLGAGLIDSLSPADEYGVQSDGGAALGGAAKGAAAGAALGLPGVVGGGLLGGVTSLIGNKKRKSEKRRIIAEKNRRFNENMTDGIKAQLAQDPDALGNDDASMYAYGGTLKGKPSNKFSLSTSLVSGFNEIKSPMPTVTVSPTKMEKGGILPIGNDRAEVIGPGHEDGGVKIPELGVELEGDETLHKNFVFSDKLGFADRHKPIAKAIKGASTNTSPEGKRTKALMEQREEELKIEQEQTKESLGLTNDLSSMKKMALGGQVNPPTTRGGKIKNAITDFFKDQTLVKFGSDRSFPDPSLAPKSKPALDVNLPETFKAKASTPPATSVPSVPKTTTPATSKRGKAPLGKTASKNPRVDSALPEKLEEKGVTLATEYKKADNLPTISAVDVPYANITNEEIAKIGSTDVKDTEGKESNVSKAISDFTPFVSNLANSFRKLPAVPEPRLNEKIAPQHVSLQASRNEATRQVRGANKLAERQMSSSAGAQAVAGATLASKIRAVNEVNQAEVNTNKEISNRAAERNLEISRENNSKLDYRDAQKVERQMAQQSKEAQNLSNFTDKLQLREKDRNLRSLEDDKLMLAAAQDNTGASWRAAKHVFKRRLTPEAYQEFEAKMTAMEAMNKEDRQREWELMQKRIASTVQQGANTPPVLVTPEKEKKKTK